MVSRPTFGQEVAASKWVLWTLLPITNWIAFFYIGAYGRHRRWLIWSAVYLAVLLGAASTSASSVGSATAAVWAVVWIASIGHALSVRSDANLRIRHARLSAQTQNTRQSPAPDLLAYCDRLIGQIEQEQGTDALPVSSPTRQRYLRALQLRADGAWMLEHAETPAGRMDGERMLAQARDALRQVRDSLTIQ